MSDTIEERKERMLNEAKKVMLENNTWLSGKDLYLNNQLDMFQDFLTKRKIFCIVDKGIALFPTYMFVDEKPLPVIAELIKIFGNCSNFYLAAWIESVNSYLGGVSPKTLLATDPQKVIKAAYDEINWVNNG